MLIQRFNVAATSCVQWEGTLAIHRRYILFYSLEVRPWINLGDYTDKEGLKEAIGQIQQVQTGGYHTYTDRALNYMRKQQLDKAREGVTKLGIVITDGLSHRQGDTAVEAALTRNDGIHVFAIGVGSLADKDELINIASLPSDDYMFQVDSYGALSRIREILAIKACTGGYTAGLGPKYAVLWYVSTDFAVLVGTQYSYFLKVLVLVLVLEYF